MFRLTARALPRVALRHIHLTRICFSTPKKGNFITSTLKYVKDVDEFQTKLNQTPHQVVADKLVAEISDKPELLSLLSLFHFELQKIGITASSSREFSSWQVLQYRALYVLKLAKIHNVFWELCQFLDISERNHKLGFSPQNIGVLDPANFFEKDCQELQSGVFRGVDFKDVQITGSNRWNK